MSQIKVLPDHLINQIAAGEVVERPASVIKELIENSLDAGATKIIIEANEGGDGFLRITDNGHGMEKDDAVLAFARHATSKISTPDDLFNINTFGFRGEAIASIASVSKINLQTKQKGFIEGTSVSSEGGKINMVKSIGAPEGTQIEVNELFYNTPARKKYLKNAATEYGHILSTVTCSAMAHPQVAIKLVHDGKLVFDLPPAEDHFLRIRSLLGRDMSDNLIPVFYGHSKIRLSGYIGKPSIARASRLNQYLFVNGREVRSHVLSYAVKQSYYSLLPKEKYPVFILFFNIDPLYVDVNVHPRKLEVRFSEEKEIFKIVFNACGKSLETHVLAPNIGMQSDSGERRQQGLDSFKQNSSNSPVSTANSSAPAYMVQDAMNFTEQLAGGISTDTQRNTTAGEFSDSDNYQAQKSDDKEEHSTENVPFQPRATSEEIVTLAQMDNSYILCRQGNSLVIIDQHAAHERIRYTEICEDFEAKKKAIQPLLSPEQLEFSHMEATFVIANMRFINELGFGLEHFGGNTFSLHSVPSYLAKSDPKKVLAGLIDDLNNQAIKGDFQNRKERALTYMACRSAVKFGDKLSTEEQTALVKRLRTIPQPYTCPHGRPTMIVMSFEELEKRFGRRT